MPQYTRNPPLLEAALAATPEAQFEAWMADARAAEMIEPTAMTLATVGADGRPSARIVLFKGLREGALTFFTNYLSRKGQELGEGAPAALVFWWDKLERQIRVEGRVRRLPRAVSEEYFYLRPRESQIGAISSKQSQVVDSRETLDQRFDAHVAQLEGQTVPFPDYWGGYALQPVHYEFWQGRRGRLHDRLCFRADAGGWVVERLEP